jgi:hypothetical protein
MEIMAGRDKSQGFIAPGGVINKPKRWLLTKRDLSNIL